MKFLFEMLSVALHFGGALIITWVVGGEFIESVALLALVSLAIDRADASWK